MEHMKSVGNAEVVDRKPKNKITPPKPPKKFKVIYHNDDFTQMELVSRTLIAYFN